MYKLYFTRKGEEYTYSLSDEDILNLLRSVSREGKPRDGVTWALINRFAWIYPEGKYPTFSSFLKAYVQPINPKWFPDGSYHKEFLNFLATKYSGQSLQDQITKENNLSFQRQKWSKLTLNEIPNDVQDVVFGVLDGRIKNRAIGAIHYRGSLAKKSDNETQAKASLQRFLISRPDLASYITLDSLKIGNNWFFTVNGSKNFSVQIRNNNSRERLANVGLLKSKFTGAVILTSGVLAIKAASDISKGQKPLLFLRNIFNKAIGYL